MKLKIALLTLYTEIVLYVINAIKQLTGVL
jgi:hypothetical protein